MSKNAWIVNENRHIYDALSKMNDIVDIISITIGKQNIFDIDGLAEKIHEKMKEYKETDYLVLCGSIPLNILCAFEVVSKYGFVDVLIYHVPENKYIPRRMEFKNLMKCGG